MSDFPGNPHAENCRRSIAEAGESIIAPEGMTDGTIAWTGMTHLADATLALAYEQRTANLIAAYGTSDLIEFDTILARLGLDDTK